MHAELLVDDEVANDPGRAQQKQQPGHGLGAEAPILGQKRPHIGKGREMAGHSQGGQGVDAQQIIIVQHMLQLTALASGRARSRGQEFVKNQHDDQGQGPDDGKDQPPTEVIADDRAQGHPQNRGQGGDGRDHGQGPGGLTRRSHPHG